MNVADRSLAIVDMALRRRFAFIELKPELRRRLGRARVSGLGYDMELSGDLRQASACAQRDHHAGQRARAAVLRRPQLLHPGREPRRHRAGHPDWWRRVVETDVRPLLEEYWFDRPDLADDRLFTALGRTVTSADPDPERVAASALRLLPLPQRWRSRWWRPRTTRRTSRSSSPASSPTRSTQRLHTGLSVGFRQTANRPVTRVRGRINVLPTAAPPAAQPRPGHCTFDEIVTDTPANRLVQGRALSEQPSSSPVSRATGRSLSSSRLLASAGPCPPLSAGARLCSASGCSCATGR